MSLLNITIKVLEENVFKEETISYGKLIQKTS